MRSTFFFTLLLIFAFTSCEKSEYSPDRTATYDSENKIFRVKVSSGSNVPYTVAIKRGKPSAGATETFDNIEASQKTGVAFEYGFTPAVGETISIIVKSSKTDVKPFAFYMGKYTFPLEMKESAEGYIGELTYKVEE